MSEAHVSNIQRPRRAAPTIAVSRDKDPLSQQDALSAIKRVYVPFSLAAAGRRRPPARGRAARLV